MGLGPNSSDIQDMFAYHPPKDESVAEMHTEVRTICASSAESLFELLPECFERSQAITKMREVMYWANAAVARHS